MSQFFDPTIRALNNNLNLRLQEQNVIAGNIANADTPGYKAKAVSFEQAMRDALNLEENVKLETSSPEHFGSKGADAVEADVYDDPNGIETLDGNTVDRAAEMTKMKENQILYNASIESLRKKLGMLEYGVTEGGGNK
ncbi:MAG: flagellar basal body rod protein FlgB [Bdellovibrionales bacterium]|nr:flagellar basal body rod protein FlgB [Bdellovibrionales bacterium]